MIKMTEKAIKELERLKAADANIAAAALRIHVKGGGCAGLSYKLEFDKELPTAQDRLYQFNDIIVYINKKAHSYLEGTEVDFSDGLEGTGFTFNNPNAKRSCGCGNSFSA